MSKSAIIVPPPPEFRNLTLEQKIAEHENDACLSLDEMELSDADMEIVAYYAIRKSK
ncbi:unnamed protein product, partial [Rotaria sp. Silwood2]